MVDLEPLQQLTQELAQEVHNKENGKTFNFIKLLFNNIESFVAVIDEKCNILYINPSAIIFAKTHLNMDVKEGDNCLLWMQTDKFCDKCVIKTCISQKKVLNEIMISPRTNIKYWRTCIPLVYDGVSGIIEIVEKYND